MELSAINNLIDELEDAETSLSNIRNLSALYNVKTHIVGTKIYDSAVKELNDILPSYLNYIDNKKRYQLQEINDTLVIKSIQNVCKEIKEFIATLYNNTDTEQERETIKKMADQLKGIF